MHSLLDATSSSVSAIWHQRAEVSSHSPVDVSWPLQTLQRNLLRSHLGLCVFVLDHLQLLSKENRRRLEARPEEACEARVDSSRAGHEQWREALQTPPSCSGARPPTDSHRPQTDSRQLASGQASSARVDGPSVSESQAGGPAEGAVATSPPKQSPTVVHSERDMARYGGRMVFRPSFHSDPSDVRYVRPSQRVCVLPS